MEGCSKIDERLGAGLQGPSRLTNFYSLRSSCHHHRLKPPSTALSTCLTDNHSTLRKY